MVTKIIGKKLKIRRKEKRMTQKQLAKLAGVSQSTISYLESDQLKTAPEADVLYRIARVLEVDFEYFFNMKASGSLKEYGGMILDQDQVIGRVPFFKDFEEFMDCFTTKAEPLNHKYFARYLNIGFGINVVDDSMFPSLIRGDRVFVSEHKQVSNGTIGFFLLDDMVCIRQFEEVEDCYLLKAINPSYPEIIVAKNSTMSFKMLGEVLFFVRYELDSPSYKSLQNFQKTFLSL